MFNAAPIPDVIADAVISAYSALSGDNLPVAVRSSATAEDLPEASFAGQQETYLNISDPEAVLEATRKCWASLWTARAIGYRADLIGIAGEPDNDLSAIVNVRWLMIDGVLQDGRLGPPREDPVHLPHSRGRLHPRPHYQGTGGRVDPHGSPA